MDGRSYSKTLGRILSDSLRIVSPRAWHAPDIRCSAGPLGVVFRLMGILAQFPPGRDGVQREGCVLVFDFQLHCYYTSLMR